MIASYQNPENRLLCPVDLDGDLPPHGTGCTCYYENNHYEAVSDEVEPLEVENDFCKKCGKNHKTNWCKK